MYYTEFYSCTLAISHVKKNFSGDDFNVSIFSRWDKTTVSGAPKIDQVKLIQTTAIYFDIPSCYVPKRLRRKMTPQFLNTSVKASSCDFDLSVLKSLFRFHYKETFEKGADKTAICRKTVKYAIRSSCSG